MPLVVSFNDIVIDKEVLADIKNAPFPLSCFFIIEELPNHESRGTSDCN